MLKTLLEVWDKRNVFKEKCQCPGGNRFLKKNYDNEYLLLYVCFS